MSDHKTGLLNLSEFRNSLAAARDVGGTLLLIDITNAGSGFMYLARESGDHLSGDKVMRQLAGLIEEKLEPGESAGRLGGDLFGVILRGPRGRAERFIRELKDKGERTKTAPDIEERLEQKRDGGLRQSMLSFYSMTEQELAAADSKLREGIEKEFEAGKKKIERALKELPLRVRFCYGIADLADENPVFSAREDYRRRKNPAKWTTGLREGRGRGRR